MSVTQKFRGLPAVCVAIRAILCAIFLVILLRAARYMSDCGDSRVGTAWRQRFYFHRRAAFDSSNHGKIFSAIDGMHGNKLLLNAERINERLLPPTEYLQRKHLEVAKNPDQ